jgi:hypothetical protein
MSKFDYGGFSVEEVNRDAPWLNLLTIARALKAGEPIPCHFARWLGEAIFRANKNENKLLINLGLKQTKGKPSQHGADDWLTFGQKIYDLVENEGLSKEQAIQSIQEDEEIPRPTLQRWYKKYYKAIEESWRIDLEERE